MIVYESQIDTHDGVAYSKFFLKREDAEADLEERKEKEMAEFYEIHTDGWVEFESLYFCRVREIEVH